MPCLIDIIPYLTCLLLICYFVSQKAYSKIFSFKIGKLENSWSLKTLHILTFMLLLKECCNEIYRWVGSTIIVAQLKDFWANNDKSK